MKSLHLYILAFWILSIVTLGAGNPVVERWWVPSLAILVSLELSKRSVQIPASHKPWFFGFCLWWLVLLLPVPDSILLFLQGGLGEYRLLLTENLDSISSTIALRPSLHFYNGATIILLYVLYLQLTNRTENTTVFAAKTSVLFACFGIVQHHLGVEMIYGLIEVPAELRSPFFASFINGNHAAYFMVCGLFLVHSVYKSAIQIGCQIILCVGIVLCESRGGLSLGALSLLWLYLPRYRALTLLSALCTALGTIAVLDLTTLTHGRWLMWNDALHILDWSWLLGIGFGGFSAAYPMIKSTPEYIQSSHLHMEYLEWILHTGIFGLFILCRFGLGLVKGYSKETQSNPWFGIVAVLMCASCVDFPLQLNAMALLFVLAISQIVPRSVMIAKSPSDTRVLLIISGVLILLTLGGPTIVPSLAPNSSQPSTTERLVQTNPLDPTVLEQHLWNQVQSIQTDSKDPLQFSPLHVPSHDETIERLNTVIVQHAHFYQSNIEAQRLLARWYRRLGSYNDACRVWKRVWSLETAILANKRDWMKEGLACDPNLWMVLTTLPDDVELLLEAARLLNAQQQHQATRFCLERAYEIEEPPYKSALQLTRWLIEQKNWTRAWTLHRTVSMPQSPTSAEYCSYLKNKGDLGLQFNIIQTGTVYKELNSRCGTKAYWTNRQWISGLKEGQTEVIQSVEQHIETHPEGIGQFWELLVQAYTLNQNVDGACHWVEQAFHNDLAPGNDALQACSQKQLPLLKPQWSLTTPEQVDQRLQ